MNVSLLVVNTCLDCCYDFIFRAEFFLHGAACRFCFLQFGDWLWSDGSGTDLFMARDLLKGWNKWGRCLAIGSGNVTKSSDCRNAF